VWFLFFLSIIVSGYKPSLKEWKNEFDVFGDIIPSISYARWGMESFYLAQVEQYKDIYNIAPSIELWGYKEGNFWMGIVIMSVQGLLFRILAYFGVRFL